MSSKSNRAFDEFMKWFSVGLSMVLVTLGYLSVLPPFAVACGVLVCLSQLIGHVWDMKDREKNGEYD